MSISAIQKLLVPFIGDPLIPDQKDIGSKIKLEGIGTKIDRINWKEYSYKPEVDLFAGYSVEYLWLHFEVKNDFFRAGARADQEAVWEDSCVEFFMSAGKENDGIKQNAGDIIYRNFEFNALGTCLSACGTMMDRKFLSPDEMKQILRFPAAAEQQLPKEGDGFNWGLSVAVPLRLIGMTPGSSFRANFYKCGDLTLKPHFLSWNSIESEYPSFHLPQFFGEIVLVI